MTSPAEECRTAAATLRERDEVFVTWIATMPDNVAESLAAWLDEAALWEPVEPHGLAVARAVNGSTDA